jgi:hypothetical protein
MSGDREDEIKAAEADMAHRGDEMEHRLDELGDHLDEAKEHAAHPPMEPDDGVAGDWEGEATGSSQGEDPEDTESEDSGEGKDPRRSEDAGEPER